MIQFLLEMKKNGQKIREIKTFKVSEKRVKIKNGKFDL